MKKLALWREGLSFEHVQGNLDNKYVYVISDWQSRWYLCSSENATKKQGPLLNILHMMLLDLSKL